MMDFALKNHDITIEKGDFALCSTDKDAIAQAITIRLKTINGEWFLDANEGIPYFTKVFGQKRSERYLRQLIVTAIETIPDVVRLDDFKAQMHANRTMMVSFNAVLSDRSAIPINESMGL
jgi:hypothetical protein